MIAIAAIAAVAIATAAIALHTAWGREQLRRIAVAELDGLLGGAVRIDRLEGSVLGELVAYGVEVDGADRRPVLAIATLRIELALWPLLARTVHVERLIADEVEVSWRDQPAPTATPADRAPRAAWTLSVAELIVRRGRVAVELGGRPATLDGVELTGALWRRAAATIATARGAARWAAGALPAVPVDGELAIEASLAPGAPLAIAAEARLGEARLASTAVIELGAGRLRGGVTVSPAPSSTPRSPVNSMAISTLDPRPAGAAAFELTLAPEEATPRERLPAPVTARLRGELIAAGALTLAGIPLRGEAKVVLAGGRARVVAAAAGPRDARLQLDADVVQRGAAVSLERGELRGAFDLQVLGGAPTPALGAARVALHGRGPLWPAPALDVSGTVDLARPARGPLRARSVHAELTACALALAPLAWTAGTVELAVAGLARGELALGALDATIRPRDQARYAVSMRARPRDGVALDASAVITPGETTRLALGDHALALGDQRWAGAGGALEIAAAGVTVRGLRMLGPAGALEIDLMSTDDRGDLTLRGELRGLDAAHVARLAGLAPTWRGGLDAALSLRRRAGRWTGTLRATARQLALAPATPPLDAAIAMSLAGTALTARGTLDAGARGQLALDAAIAAPARITDAAAWRGLSRAALRDVRVQLTRVDLAAPARLLGVDAAGTLTGALAISPSALRGELGLRAPSDGPPLAADVTLTGLTDERVQVTAAVTRGSIAVRAAATATLPARPLDPQAWRALDARAIGAVSARLEDVALSPALLAELGAPTAWRGELRGAIGATLAIEPELAAATATVTVRGAIADGMTSPIDARATVDLDGSGAQVAGAAATADGELIRATATLPLRARDLLDRGLDRGLAALRAAPIIARAETGATPAQRWAALLDLGPVRGTMDAVLEVRGTVAAPVATAALRVTELGPAGGPPALRQLDVAGTWRAGAVELDVRARDAEGGRAHALLRGEPRALDDLRLELDAQRFAVGALATALPGRLAGVTGRLDAELTLRGLDPARGDLRGTARLSRASVPLSPTLGTLRDAELTARVTGPALSLELAGQLGAGRVTARGTASLARGAPPSGRATILLRGVSLIGEHEPAIDATIDATVQREPQRWRAALAVRDARIDVPDRTGSALLPVEAPADLVFGAAQPAPRAGATATRSPELAVHVAIERAEVISPRLRGVVVGELELALGEAPMKLTGRLTTERAEVPLAGRRYQLEHGTMIFDGSLDPLLEAELSYRFPALTLRASVSERASQPRLQLSSDPASYTEDQLFAFLLGADPGGAPGSQARSAAAGLTAATASIVAGAALKQLLPTSLGLDVLEYRVASSSSSAAFTSGKWLRHNLFAGVIYHRAPLPLTENAVEGNFEWWFGHGWLLRLIGGDRSVGSAEVSHRWRW